MYINYNDYGVNPVKWIQWINSKPIWEFRRGSDTIPPNVSVWMVPGTVDDDGVSIL